MLIGFFNKRRACCAFRDLFFNTLYLHKQRCSIEKTCSHSTILCGFHALPPHPLLTSRVAQNATMSPDLDISPWLLPQTHFEITDAGLGISEVGVPGNFATYQQLRPPSVVPNSPSFHRENISQTQQCLPGFTQPPVRPIAVLKWIRTPLGTWH